MSIDSRSDPGFSIHQPGSPLLVPADYQASRRPLSSATGLGQTRSEALLCVKLVRSHFLSPSPWRSRVSGGADKLNGTNDPDLLTLRFLQYRVGTAKEQVQRTSGACLRAPTGLQAPMGLRGPVGLRAPLGLRESTGLRTPTGLWAPTGLRTPMGLRAPELGDAARQVYAPPSGEAALQRCHGFLPELHMLASVFQNAWGKGSKN